MGEYLASIPPHPHPSHHPSQETIMSNQHTTHVQANLDTHLELNPANTTECGAPMRAHASMTKASCRHYIHQQQVSQPLKLLPRAVQISLDSALCHMEVTRT